MADFSCYVVVDNQSSVDLINAVTTDPWGYWKTGPSTNINKGDSMSCQLSDKAGASAGSEGSVQYQFAGDAGGTILFSFGCGYLDDNTIHCTNQSPFKYEFYAVSDEVRSKRTDWTSSNQGSEGNIPHSGHPLSVLFIVKDA